MINKSVLLNRLEIKLIVEALKYDREENGDTKENEKEELENDLRMVLKGSL